VQLFDDCAIVNVFPPMVSEANRRTDVGFACTLKLTTPLPVLLEPSVTVTHAVLLVAVHEHVAVVVTAVDPVLALAGTFAVVGDSVYAHAAAAWLTVKTRPPIISVPVLDSCAEFAPTVKFTRPLPVPLPPLVTVIQPGSLFVTAQPQSAGAETVVENDPPADDTERVVGVRPLAQPTPL
jgi:hypothetical protein